MICTVLGITPVKWVFKATIWLEGGATNPFTGPLHLSLEEPYVLPGASVRWGRSNPFEVGRPTARSEWVRGGRGEAVEFSGNATDLFIRSCAAQSDCADRGAARCDARGQLCDGLRVRSNDDRPR